jgi:hypothetical protein
LAAAVGGTGLGFHLLVHAAGLNLTVVPEALPAVWWRDGPALLLSAVLRGSYHLYQGLGGFNGNVIMGLLFGRLYQRWGRSCR